MQKNHVAVLKPLTSLRFFAALAVVAHHVGAFPAGYLGVTFFFILSGFILAYRYAGKIRTGEDVRSFWQKRFARVYPAHILTLVAALPLLAHPIAGTTSDNLMSIVPSLLLLQSWVPDNGVYFGLNAVSWSISNEAFFYLVCPFLLPLLAGIRLRTALAASCATLLLLGIGALLWHWAGSSPLTHWLFYINPFVRLPEFVLGVVLGLAFHRSPTANFGTRWELASVIFALLSITVIAKLGMNAFTYSLAFIPASAAAVYVFARGNGALTRALSTQALVKLGEASFMLYMIHQLMIRYALFFGGSKIVAAFAGLAAIALSLPLHRWFELPMQRALRPRVQITQAG